MYHLYRLQQTDTRLDEIRDLLKDLDERPSEFEARMQELEAAIRAAEEEDRKLAARLKHLEYELKTEEGKLKQVETRMYSGKVVNPKELGDLQKDLDRHKAHKGKLEEDTLEAMDAKESHQAKLLELRRQKVDLDMQWGDEKTARKSEREALEAERLDQEGKRKTAAAQIDEPTMKKYEALRSRYHGIAVSRALKGICDACGSQIPPASMSKIQERQWETCKSCGRVLVIVQAAATAEA